MCYLYKVNGSLKVTLCLVPSYLFKDIKRVCGSHGYDHRYLNFKGTTCCIKEKRCFMMDISNLEIRNMKHVFTSTNALIATCTYICTVKFV